MPELPEVKTIRERRREGTGPFKEEEPRPGKIAYVFPGQGSQSVGMGKDLRESSSAARKVFKKADEVLDFSLSRLCFEGPGERLKKNINTQPAILTVSWAAKVASEELNPQFRDNPPSFVAGHSLGEYTALVAANVLDFGDAVRLVRERGRLMEEAGRINPGGMMVLLGLEEMELEDICQKARVEVANINSPGQIVISGAEKNLVRASDLAQERGAKRVIRLEVSIAAHSILMEPAREGLAEALSQVEFRDPEIPVVLNVTAKPSLSGREIKEQLIQQLTQPVRWLPSVSLMSSLGISIFLEFGPGQVLTGLLKRMNLQAKGWAINNVKSIGEVDLNLKGN